MTEAQSFRRLARVVTLAAGLAATPVLAAGASPTTATTATTATATGAADGTPSPAKVESHIRAARAVAMSDPVLAFRHLNEALRLEQLWSHNTLGQDSPASMAMERFTTNLARRDDDRLVRILHSKDIALPDKLSLIKVLEQEIIMNYPGTGSSTLLQEYDSEP